MTTELEQITKQVSLLNRVLELLRMQEEPTWEKLQNYYPTDKSLISKHSGKVFVRLSRWAQKEEKNWHLYAKELEFHEAWNHFLLKQWWSDELVKVAKELNLLYETTGIKRALFELLMCAAESSLKVYLPGTDPLEAMLNRYGRSLRDA